LIIAALSTYRTRGLKNLNTSERTSEKEGDRGIFFCPAGQNSLPKRQSFLGSEEELSWQ